jgi:hypothetical protein
MNVLKNSGGHISGMSNHHTQQNLNHQNHYRGIAGGNGSIGYPKPFSSPRSSQQHGHTLGENPSNLNDPNFVYQ